MILVFVTFGKKSEAAKIGKELLERRLIACYNLFPVDSAYWWKSKIVEDQEFLMIAKSKESNFSQIESFIKKHNLYTVPEVISIKADNVSKSYLDWLISETK